VSKCCQFWVTIGAVECARTLGRGVRSREGRAVCRMASREAAAAIWSVSPTGRKILNTNDTRVITIFWYGNYVKRALKRIGYCAGTLAALFLLFIGIEHFRGKWALNHRLTDLRAKGQVASVAALEPKQPAPAQNAAIALISLSNRLESVVTNLDDLPPMLRFVRPGRAIVRWRLKEWSSDGKKTNDWTKVGAGLERAADVLHQVHTALERPAYDTGFDYRKGFVDFQLAPINSIRRTAQLLSLAAAYELSRGQLETANQHLCDLVKLAVKQTPEPLIICQLVRYSSAMTAFNTIWEALQAPGWNEKQLAALQASWTGCDFGRDISNACRMELVMDIDMFDEIRASRKKLAFVIEEREKARELSEELWQSFPTHGVVLRWLHVPLWRAAWAEQDELRTVNRWQEVIEREELAETNSWSALALSIPTPANDPSWSERFRFLFSTQPFSITDAMIRRTLVAEIEQAMTVTAIAIQRYRLRTGTLPAELSALVPEYLSALPRDAMDGRTLRYGVLSDSSFTLYSVGEDGKDDRGDPTLVAGKKEYHRISDGRDMVWPSPATDDEAVAAMKPAIKE